MANIFVPVVDQDQYPLMPTIPSRARRWLKSGKATAFWKGGFFCVRLNVEPEAREYQPVACGIDPGSKKEALVVASAAHTYTNIQTDAVTWVKGAEAQSTRMRRTRRNRKMPRRKPRQNRRQRKKKLPPSRHQLAGNGNCGWRGFSSGSSRSRSSWSRTSERPPVQGKQGSGTAASPRWKWERTGFTTPCTNWPPSPSSRDGRRRWCETTWASRRRARRPQRFGRRMRLMRGAWPLASLERAPAPTIRGWSASARSSFIGDNSIAWNQNKEGSASPMGAHSQPGSNAARWSHIPSGAKPMLAGRWRED